MSAKQHNWNNQKDQADNYYIWNYQMDKTDSGIIKEYSAYSEENKDKYFFSYNML